MGTSLIVVAAVFLVISLIAVPIMITVLSRYKKSAMGELDLVGDEAFIETSLEAEGSVLVRGELWRACSRTGVTVKRGFRARVVGTSGHLLEVEPIK